MFMFITNEFTNGLLHSNAYSIMLFLTKSKADKFYSYSMSFRNTSRYYVIWVVKTKWRPQIVCIIFIQNIWVVALVKSLSFFVIYTVFLVIEIQLNDVSFSHEIRLNCFPSSVSFVWRRWYVFPWQISQKFFLIAMGRTVHYYVCWFLCFFVVIVESLLDVTLCTVTCNKIDCPNEWIFYLLIYTKHTHTKQTIFCWNRCFDSHVESCEKNNSQSIIMKKKKRSTQYATQKPEWHLFGLYVRMSLIPITMFYSIFLYLMRFERKTLLNIHCSYSSNVTNLLSALCMCMVGLGPRQFAK